MTERPVPRSALLRTLSLILLLAGATGAGAQQEPRFAAAFPHATLVSGAALHVDLGALEGLRVGIDARTGALRQPTAAEIRALDHQAPRRAFGRSVLAAPVELADGTVMSRVDPELMSYAVGWSTERGAAFTCREGGAEPPGHAPPPQAVSGEEK